MSIKSFYLRFVALIAVAIFPALSFAVTQKEMEQARTIAAKAYIRYVNDGSGYLDEIHPATLEELQQTLKPKEKENIKAFLAIPVPTDYQNWDKQKLLEYWAGTVFQNSSLVEKGRGGRILARKEINKMTVSAPQANPQPTAVPTETPKAVTETTPVAQPAASTTTADSLAAEQLQIADQLYADEEEPSFPEEQNYTWVYIMILAILVAIVIALVVYAANVMKKSSHDASISGSRANDEEPDSHIAEKYETALSDKDFEISMLTKKLEVATKQNSDLKTKVESLTSELALLRTATPQNSPAETAGPATAGPARTGSLRTIFLGRANARQIFVRADRTLNVGNSVYMLDTTDGVTGSFRVADSPAAWSLALSNPAEYLKNACTGHDLDNTNGASRIATESSGTAVFEGGAWRVIRKAKIRYE